MSWLYNRPTEGTLDWIEKKFAKRRKSPRRTRARSRRATHYGETSEDFAVEYEVAPAKMAPGTYRNITGNPALALG